MSVVSYSSNGIANLLRLSRFGGIALRSNVRELLLILGNALFQCRNVVFRVFVPSVEHVPYADKRVSYSLVVFEKALVPSTRLVLE